MIIDIHAHTSSHVLWELHVKTATLDDLEKLAKKYGIKLIFLMATYFPFKGRGLKNLELYERIKERKLFRMLGSLDAMNDFNDGMKELETLLSEKMISGIKLYPGYQEFDFAGSNAFLLYELAATHQVPVMFHTGELHHCCPKYLRMENNFKCGHICKIDELGYLARPTALIEAVKKFPEVNFIFSHLANPYFEELREAMVAYQNIFTDISGQFVSGSDEDNDGYKEFLHQELMKFISLDNGIDRLMFGTDFPIQSYADSVDMVKRLCLDPGEERKIFYQNAADLFNLNL